MSKRSWLRAVLIGGVLLLAGSFGFSRALRTSAARRYLIARLAATFGRPVDVSWFDFSLLDGARIEAHLVSVSEDPHFGGEYFLRAETLTAGLRWRSLLGGRFEFGSVSLSRPSLNLMRDSEGRWNIERWLPPVPQPGARPGFVGPVAPPSEARATRPTSIDVDSGRINFKQGDEKSPFALVDVSGRVEQNSAGRWQLDLEARPMRAGVELQDIGTVRLRGSIAGTSARLQPADLTLTWRAASLADTLRLVWQKDFGVRGLLAVDLSARIAPDKISTAPDANSGAAQWSISAVARLSGVHSWELPEHNTDPSANLSVEAGWKIGQRRADINKLVVELPSSRLQGAGELEWSQGGLQPRLQIASSAVALGDVLSWYRALRPQVAEDLRADCTLGVDLTLAGWPVQIQQGSVASAGGTLTAASLAAPLRIGPLKATVLRGGFDFAPATVSFASAPAAGPGAAAEAAAASGEVQNSFVLRGSVFPRANGIFRWPPDWSFSIEGATPRVQDWLALFTAFAQPVNSDWTAAGALAVKMRGDRLAVSPDISAAGPASGPWRVPWVGTMDLSGVTFHPAFVNQPVRVSKAHVEFAPRQRTVTLAAAEAFGAAWHGSMARKSSDDAWTFDLSADHLDAAELDRWLGPRARPGFLARFVGLNSAVSAAASPAAGAIVTRLSAHGRLRAAAIDVLPMHLEQFDGDAELAGREIRVRSATANFFGGRISGSFTARLLPDPSYEFHGRFDHVELAQLSNAVPFLDRQAAGNVSTTLALSAHGIGRQALVGSLQGEGTLNGKNLELPGVNLAGVFPGASPDADPGIFSSVQGSYRIQAGGIDLANFVLDHSRGRLEAEGRIDFSHALNLRVRPSIFQAATAPANASPPSFLLSGTIDAPKLILPSANSRPPARRNTR
jgi:hypothetical protein